jgi:hypothetical protein
MLITARCAPGREYVDQRHFTNEMSIRQSEGPARDGRKLELRDTLPDQGGWNPSRIAPESQPKENTDDGHNNEGQHMDPPQTPQ